MLAAHMDLALENEYHVLGRCGFFKQNVAGLGKNLSRRDAQARVVLREASAPFIGPM